jgi:hypothetical protein
MHLSKGIESKGGVVMENQKPIGPIFVLILVLLLSAAYFIKYLDDKRKKEIKAGTVNTQPVPAKTFNMPEYEKESGNAAKITPEAGSIIVDKSPQKPDGSPDAEFVMPRRGDIINTAYKKMVTTENGAGDVRYPPSNLTDGNPSTMAYPAAMLYNYDVILSKWGDDSQRSISLSYDIDEIVIHWGVYGEKFYGEKDESGSWKPSRNPGNYVDSYAIETIQPNADGWVMVHGYNGIPLEEKAANVTVEKKATGYPSAPYLVTTRLTNLNLKNISGIRIKARSGSHWIGIMEIEAWGRPTR